MAASADQLASRLVSGGRSIARANRVGVEKACAAAKPVMYAAAVSAGLKPGGGVSGAGGKRRNANGEGWTTAGRKSGGVVKKWNVRYRVTGYDLVIGRIQYTGPVHLLNNDTRAHNIAPRHKKALVLTDGGVRYGPVRHPGTKGKKFAQKAEDIVIPQSSRIIRAEVRSHIARTFT